MMSEQLVLERCAAFVSSAWGHKLFPDADQIDEALPANSRNEAALSAGMLPSIICLASHDKTSRDPSHPSVVTPGSRRVAI